MGISKRRRWVALSACAAAIAGSFAVGTLDPLQAQAGEGSTLNRPVDPVVLTGSDVPGLIGAPANRIVAFRASNGSWTQIPVQVDERVEVNNTQVYNLPATQTFYGSSINIPNTVYADPGTFVGADPNPNLDDLDEIAFMARDAGGPAGNMAAPSGTTGAVTQVRLDEPGGSGTGYVYLFRSNGSLEPGAGEQYVEYDFRLNSGDYKTTYNRTDGPNPESSTVTGDTYTLGFSDRWTMDRATLTKGDRPNTDLIDRMKYDIQLLCARNENTFNDEEGAFIANRSGPVRGIRSYVGSNSGPNTQNTHVFYDQAMDSLTELKVHAIPNVRSHLDLNQQASGMTLRTPQAPNGVTVDGQPDNIPTSGTPSWWTVTGPQGGMTMSMKFDTNATSNPVLWYEDNTTPTDWQCTGDGQAYGDTGAFFNSWIECTDPGLGCTDHLRGSYRVVMQPASASPQDLQRLAEQYQQPLETTVSTGSGGGTTTSEPGGSTTSQPGGTTTSMPGGTTTSQPSGGQCFTATNSQHRTAGRAQGFLFLGAVGSGDFLGLWFSSTSVRETSPGTWTRVNSC